MEKVFRTKTGFCHVLSDRIILTRNGEIGDISNIEGGNKIAPILMIYAALALLNLYQSYIKFQTGDRFFAIIFGIIGLLLVFGIFSSINNSSTPIIERNSIKAIKYKKGIPGLSRSFFEVKFQSEKGILKKRLIMLPGSLNN